MSHFEDTNTNFLVRLTNEKRGSLKPNHIASATVDLSVHTKVGDKISKSHRTLVLHDRAINR